MSVSEFLAESKRIEEAATPGPWVIDKDELTSLPGTRDWETVIFRQDEQGGESWNRDEDAEFIAYARTALPKMREALEAVIRLHVMEYHDERERNRCRECLYEDWGDLLCPTVRAIESALAEGDNK
jgi:hypothetical protein